MYDSSACNVCVVRCRNPTSYPISYQYMRESKYQAILAVMLASAIYAVLAVSDAAEQEPWVMSSHPAEATGAAGAGSML